MSVHYSETFSRVFRDTINDIENTEQESSPRGLKVKERLLATLPINPIYPISNFSDRKFNWKYFAGELAWYLKKDRDIDYINKIALDNNAKILTTEKDFLRLSKQDQFNIEFIKIYLEIKEKEKLKKQLMSLVNEKIH